MNIQLHSHVGKIVFDYDGEEVEPKFESIELQSHVEPSSMTFNIESNAQIESLDLDSAVSPFGSFAYISRKKKLIPLSSYVKAIDNSIEIKTSVKKIGTVAIASYVDNIDGNVLSTEYRFPMTYTAHLQYIENKTNLYHIE